MTQFRWHPAPPAVWDGRQLVPSSEATDAEATVWFGVPPDPDEPDEEVYWEGLIARPTETPDEYVVVGCPVLFAGVAYGDTVRVIASQEGALAVTEVVARGGYDHARAWFEAGGESWRAPIESLAERGCVVDVYSEHLVGLSWPAGTNLLDELEHMEQQGLLQYATA